MLPQFYQPQIAELEFTLSYPLDSTSRILDPRIIGENYYNVARKVQETLQNTSLCRHRTLVKDELSEEDKLVVDRARKYKDFYLSHFMLLEVYWHAWSICWSARYNQRI